MKVEYRCYAGLDVHKRTVVACVLKGELGRDPVSKSKSFGTTTAEVMEMLGWLKEQGVTHVAMEATGWHNWPNASCVPKSGNWRRPSTVICAPTTNSLSNS